MSCQEAQMTVFVYHRHVISSVYLANVYYVAYVYLRAVIEISCGCLTCPDGVVIVFNF